MPEVIYWPMPRQSGWLANLQIFLWEQSVEDLQAWERLGLTLDSYDHEGAASLPLVAARAWLAWLQVRGIDSPLAALLQICDELADTDGAMLDVFVNPSFDCMLLEGEDCNGSSG